MKKKINRQNQSEDNDDLGTDMDDYKRCRCTWRCYDNVIDHEFVIIKDLE